ncbi:MAG: hypothetical protein MUO76_20000 [Anaerolineaceae bacterium]|nr:hypothetical protein [Anaerolineaceae bacterium]
MCSKSSGVKSLILYLVVVLLFSAPNSAGEAAAEETQSEEVEGISEVQISDLIAAGEDFTAGSEYYVSVPGG